MASTCSDWIVLILWLYSFLEGWEISWSTGEVGICSYFDARTSCFTWTKGSDFAWTWRCMECFESCDTYVHLLFLQYVNWKWTWRNYFNFAIPLYSSLVINFTNSMYHQRIISPLENDNKKVNDPLTVLKGKLHHEITKTKLAAIALGISKIRLDSP